MNLTPGLAALDSDVRCKICKLLESTLSFRVRLGFSFFYSRLDDFAGQSVVEIHTPKRGEPTSLLPLTEKGVNLTPSPFLRLSCGWFLERRKFPGELPLVNTLSSIQVASPCLLYSTLSTPPLFSSLYFG